jgi:ribonucleoside-diphosphate reductase alpha chain
MEYVPNLATRHVEEVTEGLANVDKDALLKSVLSKLKKGNETEDDVIKSVFMSAVEMIGKESPNYTFVAARGFAQQLYRAAGRNRGYEPTKENPYGSFSGVLRQLIDMGIYKPELLKKYSLRDIQKFAKVIDPSLDKNYTYIGLLTLSERYLANDFERNTYELPQERMMVIAMQLMIKEKRKNRRHLVKEAYWALSNQYMTVATPTLSNSGKARGGQLSSCFIDTVPDSLEGIYDSNTDVARLSKMGGGIGVYMGKVRSRGSDIRGYKGTSSGVVPWIRQLNNTGISVDQLGTRKGSIAIYLDAYHRDIMAFLDLKLNNGDDRLRAHDIFPGLVANDLFMEAVEKREDWFLFCPHEIKKVMGWKDKEGNPLGLEDYYDEERGNGTFRQKYAEAVEALKAGRLGDIEQDVVPAIDIMKAAMKSQLETGTPYMFYKDEVNRANPNKAHGIIYSSNLCTEIMQNMSVTVKSSEVLKQDSKVVKMFKKAVGLKSVDRIVITKEVGDFVVCNLSSINLGKAVKDGVLERLIKIQVRMLDNVIDINELDVLQAQATNEKYRAVGLGTFGLHHLLAILGIRWESEEAVKYNDDLYEYIAYLAIKASMELAREKGAYSLFKGSEWHSGKYFDDRGYTSGKRVGKWVTTSMWVELKRMVMRYGIRNGYLMAIAPNGSTSILAGSTASIDPIYEMVSYEEKTTYKIANPVPDLSPKTFPYYMKNAFMLDQHWSIKMAAARQRHIDQAQSFNVYVTPEIKAKDFLELHMQAWKQGMKSTYYTRSRALTIEECESCAS